MKHKELLNKIDNFLSSYYFALETLAEELEHLLETVIPDIVIYVDVDAFIARSKTREREYQENKPKMLELIDTDRAFLFDEIFYYTMRRLLGATDELSFTAPAFVVTEQEANEISEILETWLSAEVSKPMEDIYGSGNCG